MVTNKNGLERVLWNQIVEEASKKGRVQYGVCNTKEFLINNPPKPKLTKKPTLRDLRNTIKEGGEDTVFIGFDYTFAEPTFILRHINKEGENND